jgi:hypothetical protein
MTPIGFKIFFMSIFISVAHISIAQQPFLKFKPRETDVDSFDILMGFDPFKLMGAKLNLNVEMRLYRNLTLKIAPSSKYRKDPLIVSAENLEISDPSSLKLFDEQSCLFMVKRYKSSKNSRVYFGPYLGIGFLAQRTNLLMTTKIAGFDDANFQFRSISNSWVMTIGSTKLFGKKIIFDYYISAKYKFKDEKIGHFRINALGYRSGWGGLLGFNLAMPIRKN